MALIVATPIDAAGRLIDGLLASLLNLASGASRVWWSPFSSGYGHRAIRIPRVSTIRTGAPCLPPSDVLRCIQDFPKWPTLLPALRAGRCPVLIVPGPHSPSVPVRRKPAAAFTILACPAVTAAGNLLGAVFILWANRDALSEDVQRLELTLAGRRIGGQIAATLDLCAYAAACLERSDVA